MLPHSTVWEFQTLLDTPKLPPFVFKTFDTWAHLYNHTFKEYMRLRKDGNLNNIEAHKLMNLMMAHVIANAENYKLL